MKILHITAHLGGGVGKIISSVAINDKENEHLILILQKPENLKFNNLCIENNVNVFYVDDICVLNILSSVDIVQLEWWHNPITMEFMYNHLQDISCRLIIWSHTNGCNFPFIPTKFVELPLKFIFSSEYSLDNPTFIKNIAFSNQTSVIVSTGIDECKIIQKIERDTFNIGYLGTISYNKNYVNIVQFYEAVANKIDNVKFILAGDIFNAKDVVADFNNSKIANKVEFSGFVNDVKTEFSKYDIFSYLLNDNNYATAENALLEAMAYGLCPIVFNQCTEKYIVQHMETGLVVNNMQEYIEAVLLLYEKPKLRKELGVNAHNFVKENMMIQHTILKFQSLYKEVIQKEKKSYDIIKVFGNSPKDWFFTCFNGDINNMTANEKAINSSGLGQYENYFKGRFL